MNRQKYRIVTNGLRYRVQVRSFFGWRDADTLDARKWAEVK